ncbi:MAG: GH3 auxin-responsive promoter family protein [Gammaproteobacteria bacterium]|nr:GH3 auxin-responsive promoter family protein [Gammaproteobacteria bacterium]
MTEERPPLKYAALRAALAFRFDGRHQSLLNATGNPRAAQNALLRRILVTNANTHFGARHNFRQIRDPGAYRQAVPTKTYEDLRKYVEVQDRTGQPYLTADRPVYYHRTSGTLGAVKDIPVTSAGLGRVKENQQLFAYSVARGTRAFEGRVLGITGQAIEGLMPSGLPYGSASGLLYKRMSKLVRRKYVLPPEIADIPDYDLRYFATAAFALAERNVTGIGTANPSTLVRILDLIQSEPEALIEAVHEGRLPEGADLPADSALTPDRGRARDLEGLIAAKGELDYAAIWPNLKGIMTWTGGSCSVPLRRLADSIPAGTSIIELGYIASEFQGTINIDAAENICVPTLLDNFFEFVEREAREAGSKDFLLLDELEEGGEYYVFVTTQDGLYRYDMNDIVRVPRMLNSTPCLEFVQKGKGVTSITGEKLYEKQVLDAVMAATGRLGVSPKFFVMLADQEAAAYGLYIEASSSEPVASSDLADAVDRGLREANIEYDGKRGSGRLAPVEVKRLRPGTGGEFRADRVAAGQRDSQFKYLHLQYAHECPFDFGAHAEPG